MPFCSRNLNSSGNSSAVGYTASSAVPPQPIVVCAAKPNGDCNFIFGKCERIICVAVKVFLLFYHTLRAISNTFQIFFDNFYIPFLDCRAEPFERIL